MRKKNKINEVHFLQSWQIRALNTYHFGLFPALVDNSDDVSFYSDISNKYMKELGDYIYMIYLLLKFSDLDLCATATSFQHLFKAFWWNQTTERKISQCFTLIFSILSQYL